MEQKESSITQTGSTTGKLGSVLFIIAVILWATDLSVGQITIYGYTITRILFILGIVFMLLGTIPCAIAFLLIIFGIIAIFSVGLSDEGFSFSKIPIGNYILGIILIVMGLSVIKIFGIVNDRCSKCDGTGKLPRNKTCDDCGGDGFQRSITYYRKY